MGRYPTCGVSSAASTSSRFQMPDKEATPVDGQRLLTDLLKGVSRSFYLTLRVLPGGIREPVGLAYLLARAADTIADTTLIPHEERLKHLLDFRSQVAGPTDSDALRNIGASVNKLQADSRHADGARQESRDVELLMSLPSVFALLDRLPAADRDAVRSVVVALTRGMEIDLRTFPAEDSGDVVAFSSAQDLDEYVYHVAGCVGEFWTAVTTSHTPSLRHWDSDNMSGLGVRFGKALQMTNILRDVPRDLRIGRCYLTSDALAGLGLAPKDLLDPSNGLPARPALSDGIKLALEHYEAAEQYVLAIPRRNVRLRLAALWPLVIGLGTLAELATNQAWLNPDSPSKVSRGWVYRALAFSLLVCRSNGALRWWIGRLRRRVESGL